MKMKVKTMDNIIITGHNYSNNPTMLINILAVVVPILIFFGVAVYRESKKQKITQKKCGCGRSTSGYCDDSHNTPSETKENNSAT